MQQGSFGVKRTTKPFSRIPVDLTLEQTINGEAARRLTGIINFTNSISARQLWARNHGARTKIISYVLNKCGLSKTQDISEQLKPHRIHKSQKQVEAFTENLLLHMNPFDPHLDKNKLFNVGTGQAAVEPVADFLLNAEQNGKKLRDEFIEQCDENGSRFNEKIKKNEVWF